MRTTTSTASLALFALALIPQVASASASALAYVQDTRGAIPATPPAVTGAVAATMTAGTPQSFQYAFALADQDAGVLRIVGNSGNAGQNFTTTNASASFTQAVTFSGGFGQTAYLDYSFEGSLGVVNGNQNVAADFGQLQVYAANIFGSTIAYETLSAFPNTCGPGCQVGTSTARIGSISFTIAEGLNTLIASLQGFGSFGNSFDFGNTAKFYLRTPDGVTFSSTSAFLSSATPILAVPVAPVPEPETYALMLAGLGLLGAAARRRPRQRR